MKEAISAPSGMEGTERKDVSLGGASRWGIACVLAWAFWLNGASGEPADQPPWQLSYVVLSVMMAALGFAAFKRKGLADRRQVGMLSSVIGVVGTAVLCVALNASGFALLQVPAYLACGCALGLSYLQWGPYYARLSTRDAVATLFVSNIAAAVLKSVVHFAPEPVSFVLAAALPLGSTWACVRAKRCAPDAPKPKTHFERGNLAGLWKVFAALAVFSFLAAFLLGRSVGNQSAVPPLYFMAARLFEVFVSAVVLGYAQGLGRPFSFAQLWRIVLMILAVDVLLQTLVPELRVLRSMESAAWDLIVLFSWLTISDIARHASADYAAAFGLGWPFYTLPFAVGSLVASNSDATELGSTMVAVVLFVLLATSAFCLEVRDQDTKWIFSELDDGAEPSEQAHAGLEERCAELAAEKGLSPRELEVMQYLCKGRTKAYIAETLYLSENTVRSHTKHIYTKLDVHSRRELLDLVGVE